MTRSSWAQLSPGYRARLERGGITSQMYNSGVSLESARGHAATPERPVRAEKNPQKYQKYLAKRKQLEQQVVAKKNGFFGNVHKFRHGRAGLNVERNPITGKQVPLADLRKALAMTEEDWLDRLSSQTEQWAFMFYH